MAVVHNNPRKSVEEFFALRESDPHHRYEYSDGSISMMPGGTPRHAAIGSNLNRIIGNHLLNRPCVTYDSDACVMVSADRYGCPDVTVSCDSRDSDEEADEDQLTVLHYPCLVIEVLSLERGANFELYKDVPAIQEYVGIETKATPKVLVYRREQHNLWMIHILTLDDEIELISIGLSFPVVDIYHNTRFSRRKREQ